MSETPQKTLGKYQIQGELFFRAHAGTDCGGDEPFGMLPSWSSRDLPRQRPADRARLDGGRTPTRTWIQKLRDREFHLGDRSGGCRGRDGRRFDRGDRGGSGRRCRSCRRGRPCCIGRLWWHDLWHPHGRGSDHSAGGRGAAATDGACLDATHGGRPGLFHAESAGFYDRGESGCGDRRPLLDGWRGLVLPLRLGGWAREGRTAVIVYRSGLTKGTGVLSGARRIDVTMSITRIPL